MTRSLNIGGHSLYVDGYSTNDSHLFDETGETLPRKTIRTQDEIRTWEIVGGLVGAGVGIAFGYATLPVVAVDGPLPFLDLAWAYTTARISYRAIETGRTIGRQFD